MTLLCGPQHARRATATLVANWTVQTAYVLITKNYTPWLWFWIVDLASAATLSGLRPVSKWQSGLVYLYMVQLGFHGGFALFGRARHDIDLYLAGLDVTLAIQMLLVFIWTGGNGLYRFCRAHSWCPPVLNTFLGWAAR